MPFFVIDSRLRVDLIPRFPRLLAYRIRCAAAVRRMPVSERNSELGSHGRIALLVRFSWPAFAWPVESSRMASDPLLARSKKQLADMARKKGIAGWHSMRKEDLLKALATPNGKKKVTLNGNGKKAVPVAKTAPTKPEIKPQRAAARDTSSGTSSAEEAIERSKYDVGAPTKDLSSKPLKAIPDGYGKDRIVAMVRDPYWLHVYWELTHQAVQRAEAALGQDWHGSKPILRVFDVSSNETTSTSESVVRDLDIHGGCNSWYVEVQNPPRSYRVDVGYLSKRGHFFVLARSNVVSTPRAGVSDRLDENWADFDTAQAEKIFAMSSGYESAHAASSLELKELFEERLRRPIGSPAVSSLASGAGPGAKARKFWFQLDAELIVYGATEPNARVTLQGEPVKLRPDGTFTMRFSLPDGRQIIPAVASSADGVEERTVVLAVERNTKQLEPMIHEFNDN